MFRIILLVLLYTTFATPAYAYIDVALGSMILQGLIAGMVSIAVIWRSWIDKVKAFFGKGSVESVDVDDEEVSTEE